jgi:methylene-fatty-acyl-phospholipid synthase
MTTETAATGLSKYIRLDDSLLWASAAHVVFNPLFWNIAARAQYRRRTISRLFGGRRLAACYALAVVIFCLGLTRDYLYSVVVARQPSLALSLPLPPFAVDCVGYALYGVGMMLVLTSTYRLGIVGTYLGDYFGFLLPGRVTAFPFSVTSSPMYTGSTLSFLGHAVLHRSPAGLVITALVYVVYKVACIFEE